MHDLYTKLVHRMVSVPLEVARAVWVARVRAERTLDNLESDLVAAGYERVYADDPITADGRKVLRFNDRQYALRPEVHGERLAAAFESAKKQRSEPNTKSVVGTESLSNLVCPKCGDALLHTAICPKCPAGQLGYRHRYTCVCGGADLVSKEAL